MVTLLEHMWNPPIEGGLMVNASNHGNFSGLNGDETLLGPKVSPKWSNHLSNVMCTVSQETTLAYVIDVGALVRWLPATG